MKSLRLKRINSIKVKALKPEELKKIAAKNLEHIRTKATLLGEFKEFLKEYKVLGLAVAFIMGATATTLVKALVEDIIMPIVTVFVPGGAWKEATLTLGPIVLKWGAFLAEFINFVLIALAVFMIAKYLLREEKVTKK